MTRAAGLALAVLALAAGSAQARPASSSARTPIEHFVVVMQENHSFDNYFGTYPGAEGIPRDTCMPAGSACVRPFHLGGRAVPDLPHDPATLRSQYAGGRMNGFVRAATLGRQAVEPAVMGHYDRRDLPFYWRVADEYVLFDRFFASTRAGGAENHLAWVGGRAATPGRDVPTVFDRLDARGISWKFYVQDYDRRERFSFERGVDESAQAARVPLLNMPRYVRERRLSSRIVDLDQYFEDLEQNRLPAVAYIAPRAASEHPPGRIASGALLVRRLIGALMRSSAWTSSAFMWTYDESGGWYDHVRPPTAAHGFRVPALLVSPYARRGLVDSTTLETSSIPKFVESNWGLRGPIGSASKASGFARAFDFSTPPRRAALLAAARAPDAPPKANRALIYAGYGAAVLLCAICVALAALGRLSLRRGVAPVLWLGLTGALLLAPAARAQTIRTVPPVPGMRFAVDGVSFTAGPDGVARPPLAPRGPGSLRALDTVVAPGVRAKFDRWYRGGQIAALNLYYRVEPRFVDLDGDPVDPGVITRLVLRGSDGSRRVFAHGRPQWLEGNRVVPESSGGKSTSLFYVADRVVVAGTSVVHRAQQRFFPARSRRFELRLLFFSVRFTVRDALLGFPIGSAVRVRYPSGQEQRHLLGPGADLTVRSLPRGDYRVRADAPGLPSSRPVALSKDQVVELQVVSWLDVMVVLMGLGSVALALLFARRPTRRLERR